MYKKKINLFFICLMILMCCVGCGKETTNHNRYNFTNIETINNFLKDSLTIK